MMSARDDRDWRDAAAVTAPAARLGADLRAARERLGWTLPAIAAHLRIRLPFLEAIEQGRVEELPGNAYALGFVRTYAQALGLDVTEVARRFRAEAAEVNRRTELDFPAPVPDRGVPALAVVLVGLVVMVGGYAAWYRISGNARPSVEAVQPVPPRLAPLVADKPPAPLTPAPLPSAPLPSAPLPSAGAAPPAAPAVAPAPAETRVATVVPPPPPPASAAVIASPSVSPSSAAAATTDTLPPPDTGLDPAAGADAGHIVLRATADAWMQVRDRGGQVLLNRVLQAGESWPVPPGHKLLTLTTGNAGGTELVVDGVAGPPLGGDGAVRRDMPLNADTIKGGNAGVAPAHHIMLPHNQ